MKLVIAEKPSVAMSLSKVIGADKRMDGYLEGNGYIVSWCVGHLVESAPPEAYDEKYRKWRKEDLPIFPETFEYLVSKGSKKQFDVLKKLMGRADVTSLICATDAGREGELIFRLVYQKCGCRKPFERLWISSMEDSAIQEGFAHLGVSADYDALYSAALSREQADWLVGINMTRFFSSIYHETLNTGRVMSPVLAMTTEREESISSFVPESFFRVNLTMDGFSVPGEKLKTRDEAEAAAAECLSHGSVRIGEVRKAKKHENAPALYDLTSLQREANKHFGFTASQTLEYAQSLYEKKLITYPRTDSRYLTDDMEEALPKLVKKTAAKLFPEAVITKINTSQVIDSKKVTDHHALIPTAEVSEYQTGNLPKGEQMILCLVALRLLTALSGPYIYEETIAELRCGEQKFTVKGRTVIDEGWKVLQRLIDPGSAAKKEEDSDADADTDDTGSLPELREGDILTIRSSKVKEGQTKPKKHFTEGTLLLAMETAGADETPDEAERKGLGTPATRASIIEKLVNKGFLERKGGGKAKKLIPTEKGKALVSILPGELTSPLMTACWEEKLLMIERGEYQAEAFIEEIKEMVRRILKTYEPIDSAAFPAQKEVIGSCPHCGADVVRNSKGWACSNRDCRFALWDENGFFKSIGRKLDFDIANKIVNHGFVRLNGCRSRRTGKKFDCLVRLSTQDDGSAEFRMEFEK